MISKKRVEPGASITVFLSLILLLVLAIILTTLEGARISIAKTYAQRSLSTAMDSVLAEYYGPLMKEYHIFGLDAGYGSDQLQEYYIEAKLQEYMSYTFHPNKDLELPFLMDGVEIFNLSSTTIDILDRTKLLDHQGELFLQEAITYMKYKSVANGVEELLRKGSMLKTPEKVTYLYEEKQKVEEELVEIDQGILILMELIDGIETGEKGIKTNSKGELQIVSKFVKKICFGEITKEQVGINSEIIYRALQSQYINPTVELDTIDNAFKSLLMTVSNIKVYESEYLSLQKDSEVAEEKIRKLEDEKRTLEADDEAVHRIEIRIKELTDELKMTEQKKKNCRDTISSFYAQKSHDIYSINLLSNTFQESCEGIIPKIDKTFPVLTVMKIKSSGASDLIRTYEEQLNDYKDDIDTGIFSSLFQELKELKKYTSDGDFKHYDFVRMEQILKSNKEILNQTVAVLKKIEQYIENANYDDAYISFQSARSSLMKYQTKGLTLDYSTLVLQNKSVPDPLDMISSLLKDGLLSLVIDPSSVSKAELTQETLPSSLGALTPQDNTVFDITDFIKSNTLGGSDSDTSNFFGSFDQYSDVTALLKEGISSVVEKLLLDEYFAEHFYGYPISSSEISSRKPSVLTYEQEYILAGHRLDKDNLKEMVSNIILLRTLLNFVSILGDSVRNNEARATAAALVGFTGLPILISIIKTVILILWAFAEALVDTSALLKGKEIPILKIPKELVIQYPDLFLLNRDFIDTKASSLPDHKGVTSLSYRDYIRIFILTKDRQKISYRAMDLIQENIRIRYEDNFRMANCLFGLKVKAEYLLPERFLKPTFLQKYRTQSNEQSIYSFSIQCSNCY
ncbi:MAG: hypothetical protein K0S47_2307 [Herbinix sp.]|jgi:hypothetical protein|nr:hypothetical protein [Herbinix sp.]